MTAVLRFGVCAMFALTTGLFGVAMIVYAVWNILSYATKPNRYDP